MSIRYYGPTLVLLATVGLVMLLGPGLARKLVWDQADARITQVRQGLLEDAGLASLSEAFARVADVVEPSVVHVQVLSPPSGGGGFFSRLDPPRVVGSGSGWVYRHRDDGEGAYILTNHHVVADAGRVRLRFADGSEAAAELINSDPLTDVAVLEVEAGHLHPAAVSPAPVRKGQIVFAFGSPFRFDFSVSQGIVSASGRQLDVTNSGKYEDYIQTDAAINRGNSGGPLTDIYGRVVGMNTFIVSERDDPTAGFMGLGFAIPVEMAAQVADRIIERGEVRRGYLGVYIDELTPETAATLGYGGRGVLLQHPIGGGPADRAGLKPGDVITHIAGRSVADVDALRYRVASFSPGQRIEVTVFRDGRSREVGVTLDELPTPTGTLPPPLGELRPTQTWTHPRLTALGIERVAPFDADDAAALGVDHRPGVMLLHVRPGSAAASMSVMRGQLLTRYAGRPVADLDDLEAAVDAQGHADPRALPMTLLRWDPTLGEFVSRLVVLPAAG